MFVCSPTFHEYVLAYIRNSAPGKLWEWNIGHKKAYDGLAAFSEAIWRPPQRQPSLQPHLQPRNWPPQPQNWPQ